jgi:microcystin degradation protein MlrC
MSKKIFTACLGTETNTFASIPTGHQLFEETCLYRKGSYGKDTPMFGAPLAVWRQRGEAKGWTVVESLCAFAQPAGRTVKKVYEAFRDEIIADLKAAMPVDAVFLSCHGAMVAEGYDDCESDLLAHVRQVVGRDIPVGVEFDLHCNVGEGTMRDATALVLFKEYPHVDVSDRADDLFNVMEGAIEGRTRPVMATFDCRMIGVFHTTRQPMRGFVDKLSSMEGKDGVLSLSIAHGFPWSDIKEMSSRIIAITDNDKPKAEKLAKELGLEFFAMREVTQPPYVTLDAAMARVSSHNLPKPMVLADVSDNAGGGAASDSTFILQALLDRKVQDAAIAMFWDPGAVKLAFEVGEGAELDIRLGGKLGPQSGPPIDARAKVLALGREVTIKFGGNRKGVNTIGDAAALQIEGVTVIVNTKRSQCHSLDCFTKLGIDPSTKKVVVVKSMQHFHAAYAPIASEVVYVAAPGALVPDWSLLPYKKADKTQWPFVANPHG